MLERQTLWKPTNTGGLESYQYKSQACTGIVLYGWELIRYLTSSTESHAVWLLIMLPHAE